MTPALLVPQGYLVSLFLDCPPGMGLHCPGVEARAKVEAAIRSGVITWHAFPHNAQVMFLIRRSVGVCVSAMLVADRLC